jgi:hypothetical protein
MGSAQVTDTTASAMPMQIIAAQSAIDAIDLDTLIRQAAKDGVVRSQIDVSPFGTQAGWARVIFSVEMTLPLVKAWSKAALQAPDDDEGEEELTALRLAIAAVYRAYDDVRGRARVAQLQ